MAKKFFLNKFTIVVLSEDAPLEFDDLADIDYEIDQGDCVGGELEVEVTQLTSKEAADKLYELGSEPGFFQLDDNGKDLNDQFDSAELSREAGNPFGISYFEGGE